MANTIDAIFLDKELYAQSKIDEAQHPLAPISLFSSRFDAAEVGTVNIKYARVGSGGTETNPSDYIGGAATLANVAVAVNEKSRPFEITNVELNNSIKLADLEGVVLTEFLTDLVGEVTALMTVANFGASAADSDVTVWAPTELPKMAVECKGMQKVALLDPTRYAPIIPTNGDSLDQTKSAYGFSNGVHMVDTTFGAGGVEGFAGGATSIAIAGGLPSKWTSFAAGEEHTIIQTALGLPILYRRWVDSNTGTHYGNYVTLFGASVADLGSGTVLTDLTA